MQQTAGSMHHIKFWQTDLLAGLLMQAIMLIGKTFAGQNLLQCMVSIGSNIATDAGDLNLSLFVVPAASNASEGSTRWLALFWNMLELAKEASEQNSSAALLSLTLRLSDAFAYNGAEASRKVKKRVSLFWQTDCLAQALLQALQSYVSSGHAELDALTIQGFLVQQAALQASQPTQQPTDQAHEYPQAGVLAGALRPVDAASLAAALAELHDGTSVSSLARLEQRLLHHFQVLLGYNSLKQLQMMMLLCLACVLQYPGTSATANHKNCVHASAKQKLCMSVLMKRMMYAVVHDLPVDVSKVWCNTAANPMQKFP